MAKQENLVLLVLPTNLRWNVEEQEIQQWREERRKNHPSKTNIEKKLTENLTEPEATNKDAKLRRQQLKEILAKQAELGCEVAEIPSYYLSDSEKQVNGREANNKAMTKKDRYHNKSNKRGRFRQNDRFSKKQRLTNHDSCEVHDQTSQFSNKQIAANNDPSARPTLSKKEPTLLQKLLSADIRRGKSHMLQVFRFMLKNEFFKEWPEKPLRFPVVIVKESGSEGEVVEEKSLNSGKCVSKGSEKTMIEAYEDGGDDYDVDNNNGNDSHLKETVFCASLKGRIGEEEEGEIID
ncbi:hypothetical protein F0562_029549 [Nyssa sinensis]|uniref:FMR1-interacting protein 1 conserved domain-containing protein n=1 Tax=Nyssa sinensis TaxID=561372 RepID=A0A5J5B7C4_9ASTE|nr:hypothetical protein F0562_029549 [Nyssa sinensis]